MTGRPAAELGIGEYRALAEFRHALRQFLRFSEQAARDAGLTPAQHQLLLAIKGTHTGGQPTLGDIAEMLQLRLHSTSELVERAVAKGLVSRITDPDDHRRVLLGLTPEGEDRLAALTRLHRDEVRRFRQTMTAALGAFD